MDDLSEIYKRIEYLRNNGVKMKDIAEQANITPSVLSAIYFTVFPAFFKNIEKGLNEEDALNDALTWVNNVSKKKLFGSLSSLKRSLFEIPLIPVKQNENTYNPFLSSLEANIKESVYHIINYSGIISAIVFRLAAMH